MPKVAVSSKFPADADGSRVDEIVLGDFFHKVLFYIDRYTSPSDLEDAFIRAESAFGFVPQGAERVMERLKNMLERGELLRKIMEGRSLREVEVVTKSGLRRIDRLTFINDKVYVVDYKFGRRKREDKEQLEEYMEAIKAVYPERKVRGVLVYVLEGEVEEL